MKEGKHIESKSEKKTIFKPNHSVPGRFFLDYILLPYGIYYEKTNVFLKAKKGDFLRFYNGPQYKIDSVSLIKQDRICDILCRMRYGIPWQVAFEKWERYARLEGHNKEILSTDECLLIVYEQNSM